MRLRLRLVYDLVHHLLPHQLFRFRIRFVPVRFRLVPGRRLWIGADLMQAFHSNWTRPFFIRNPHMEYRIEPFELLTTALSALEWRRENGSDPHDRDTPAKRY